MQEECQHMFSTGCVCNGGLKLCKTSLLLPLTWSAASSSPEEELSKENSVEGGGGSRGGWRRERVKVRMLSWTEEQRQ